MARKHEVLKINPKSVRGLVRIGVIYKRAQNPDEAEVKFKEAQKLDSTFAPAYRENAEMYMKYNMSKKAIDCWKLKAIDWLPRCGWNTRNNLKRCSRKLKNLKCIYPLILLLKNLLNGGHGDCHLNPFD